MRLSVRRTAALIVLAGLLLPSLAAACMWDHDTIKMERSRFPGTLELITGKFLRHSPEFYRWRIEDRVKRLAPDPTNAALRDDLAVAYDKVGNHDRAIATTAETESLQPGRYETASNLATFYFHAGKLDEALTHVNRALAINPDAHFGREKYQKALTEYVLARQRLGNTTLPLAGVTALSQHEVTVRDTFADFILPKGRPGTREEDEAAIKGVLGMMRFANHESPILLEALGTLLARPYADPKADAKLLATRAFLKASYDAPDGQVRGAYRDMAARANEYQTLAGTERQISLEEVEAAFSKELQEGREWYAALRERELSWIKDGRDPEVEFDKLYDADPQVAGLDVPDPMSVEVKQIIALVVFGALALVVLALTTLGTAYLGRRLWKQHREPGGAASTPPPAAGP